MASADGVLGDHVPEQVILVWDELSPFHVPENLPEEVAAIYQRGVEGKCMLCENEVAEEALIIVNAGGLNQLYCSHRCNQDMNNKGWLEQMYDDMVQAIEFRRHVPE